MTIDEAMARLRCADADFLKNAGPAVLRLKLLEVSLLAQNRRLPRDVRDAAQFAASELRKLILQRPCASAIDSRAQRDVARAA